MKTQYMTISEAARTLGVTRKTIYQMFIDHRLTQIDDPVKHKGSYVQREEIERLCEQQEKSANSVGVELSVDTRILQVLEDRPASLKLILRWEEEGQRVSIDLDVLLRNPAYVDLLLVQIPTLIKLQKDGEK